MKIFLVKIPILFIVIILMCLPLNILALRPESNSDLSSENAQWIKVDDHQSPLLIANGIGFDSTGKLYICNSTFHKLQVYRNGEFAYSYDVNTTGALFIRVDSQDNLYISDCRADYGYKYKNKRLIEVVSDYNRNKYYPQDDNTVCNDKYGNKYNLHNVFGYVYVSKTTINNVTTTIFSMSIKEFVLILLIASIIIIAFCILLIFVIRISIQQRKINNANRPLFK